MEGQSQLRKLIFFAVITLGALIGLLSAARDDWGTRFGMICVGVLFALPVGGIALHLGKNGRIAVKDDAMWSEGSLRGQGTSLRDLVGNYWRDKGAAPFTKTPDREPDHHQFDPDRIA